MLQAWDPGGVELAEASAIMGTSAGAGQEGMAC